MIPDAQVGFIGLARNEETHEPVPYLACLARRSLRRHVFLVDPMLATGGSLLHALQLLVDRGADNITAVCLISAQQGVDALAASGFPVRLITAAIDPELNSDAYIVPGLGDAGDRLTELKYRSLNPVSGVFISGTLLGAIPSTRANGG